MTDPQDLEKLRSEHPLQLEQVRVQQSLDLEQIRSESALEIEQIRAAESARIEQTRMTLSRFSDAPRLLDVLSKSAQLNEIPTVQVAAADLFVKVCDFVAEVLEDE